jgi:Zn-dependent M28 family amino/carboxypeptidase
MAGFRPIKPVEFHWYAAEEGGLLGSRDIVKSFVELNREVEAMLQFVSAFESSATRTWYHRFMPGYGRL